MTIPVRAFIALVAAWGLMAGSAAGADPAPPVVPLVRVTPLRDAGGLPDSGKLGLNLQLTQGLVKYLTDQAQGRYTVVAVDSASAAPQSKRRRRGRHERESAPAAAGLQITLEGELSHVEAAGDKDGGPYFCSLRLFQDGVVGDAPRRLVHGWAALARTYLDLTGNLGHDPRVDPEGLLGELAHRVIADVTGPTTVSPAANPSADSGPAPVQILDSADGIPAAAPPRKPLP